LFILAEHLPPAAAQPSHPVRVWLDSKDDANRKVDTKSNGTWIDLAEHPVSAKEISRISTLKGVTGLDIGYFPDVVQIDGKALSKIGDIKGLRGLSFYITGVKEEDWSVLAKLSKLEYLRVDGEQLDLGDDFLQFVSRLKRLKTLQIAPHSNFSDEGIAKLASLQNLTELSLSSSLMTDRSLRTIGELKKLRILYLASPHLTDDAAERLANSRTFEEITVGKFHRTNDKNAPKN
jgi:Leucine-rich repeat (LRR) protein